MSTHPPAAPVTTPPPTPVRPPGSATSKRSGRGRARWLWLVVGGLVALGKVEAYRHLLVNPAALIVALAAGLVASVLRTSPVGLAVCAAGLIAFVIGPASTLVGIALGAGGFVVLMVLLFAVATILRARQHHWA